jgi:hypothetical protein
LAAPSEKQSDRPTKPSSALDAEQRKRAASYVAATNFGGHVMSTKTNIVKYLAFRTAAFVGLTAVSTAVMALPYMA